MSKLHEVLTNPEYVRSQLEVRLRLLLEAFCAQTAFEGYAIRPTSEQGWKKFLSLSDAKKNIIYKSFLSYYELACVNMSEGHKISNSTKLVWNFLKKMNLRPSSDLFNNLTEEHIVEIYGQDFIQIFRNLNFFNIVSYSLIDIFVYEWPDLFIREDKITQSLAKTAIEVLSGKHSNAVGFEVGDHKLIENFSEEKHEIQINHNFISPLFNNKKIEYFLVASNGTVVGADVQTPKNNIINVNFTKKCKSDLEV